MAIAWNLLDGGSEPTPRSRRASSTAAPTSGALPASFKPTVKPIATTGPIQGPQVIDDTPFNPPPTSGLVPNFTPYVTPIQPAADTPMVGPIPVGASRPTITAAGAGQNPPEMSSEMRDAFKLLEDTFTSYGLSALVPRIRELMIGIKDPATGKYQQIGPNEALIILRQTPEYQTRFAGNYDPKTGRVARGLNALSEAEYLRQEDAYSELFQKYGVANLANKKRLGDLIAGDISPTELNSRLNLAVMNVQNADPTVLATLKAYYPGVSQKDLLSYFLAPEETLPDLERRVTAAEIGGAAMMQGFKTDTGLPKVTMTRAEELARAGVTGPEALKGYKQVAYELPAATKLAGIYGAQTGKTFGQTELENQYLLSSSEAAQRQRELNKLEAASFSGSTGTNPNIAFLRRPTTGQY